MMHLRTLVLAAVGALVGLGLPGADDAARAAPTREPLPFIRLRRAPARYPIISEASPKKPPPPKGSSKLASERRRILARRDKLALPAESLGGPLPRQFCVGGKCFPAGGTAFTSVARAVYGGGVTRPVFCAPRKGPDGKWKTDKVWCSGQWLDTLGGWKPWRLDSRENTWVPAGRPDDNQVPPFACVGAPHLTGASPRGRGAPASTAILPPGGADGLFRCRRRIFRIQVKKAEKTLADLTENIRQMCAQMRDQVWGERYQAKGIDINREYRNWCRKHNIADCKPPQRQGARSSEEDKPAFIPLSREELIYFFGHRQLYCRADRSGLVHFLFNDEWAESFTCDVPRGLLEAGPFEEGVQTCAMVPFYGGEVSGRLTGDDLKARLHCWKFNRPRCEQVSNPAWQKEKGNIHRSNVFDAYDALLQVRRTRNPTVWSLFDLKDAEKLPDSQRKYSYMDTSKDEGVFGVKDFCRVVSMNRSGTEIQCGFTKKTMAHWYEMRAGDKPEGCASGICSQGAFSRGYSCGIFYSPEYFPKGKRGMGKPFWLCGFDSSRAGQAKLKGHRAICLGGAKTRGFQSAKGDRSSLQCYERRFLWGESKQSKALLDKFRWKKLLESTYVYPPKQWTRYAGRDLYWVMGGLQLLKKKKAAGLFGMLLNAKNAKPTFDKDRKALIAFASRYGHTLGHRTSMRLGALGLSRSGVIVTPVRNEFFRLSFKETKGNDYRPMFMKCKGRCPLLRYAAGEDGETAVNKDRAKELNGLVNEVKSGSRAPDAKWFQDFRLIATEGFQLRIPPKQYLVALRLHYAFRFLEKARTKLLKVATQYRDAVVKASKRAPLQARPELHATARGAKISAVDKGNVFCIAGSLLPSGRHRYHCGSSPLLVAGQIERIVGWKLRKLKRRKRYRYLVRTGKVPRGRALIDKIRNQVKTGWCYGGTQGQPLFGRRPSRALSENDLASPYRMVIPDSVFSRAPRRRPRLRLRLRKLRRRGALRLGPAPRVLADARGRTACSRRRLPRSRLCATRTRRRTTRTRRRTTRTRRRTTRSRRKATPRLRLRRGLFKGLGKALRKARAKRKRKPKFNFKGLGKVVARAQKSSRYVTSPVQRLKSSVHWMKCVGFQYSDETWADADPSREPKEKSAKKGAAAAAKGPSPVGGDPRAEKETAKIMSKVGGLLVSLVKFVLPKFGDALQRVKDLANMAAEFYNKYVKRFVDMAVKVYKTAKKVVDTAKKVLEGKNAKVAELLELAWKAGEKAAGDPKNTSLRKKANELRQAYTEAKKAVKTAQKGYDEAIKTARKKRTISGTGAMVTPMLKNLIEIVAKRISATVKPGARNLLSQGFKFVRSFLDPVVQSVISALAGIPFVGAALAAAGQVAYSLAMNYLENAAFDALFGIVERLLAKLIQPVVTPILKAVQKKVLELAGSALAGMEKFRNLLPTSGTLKFSALPPKDRWIKRALACSAPPVDYPRIARDAALARANIMHTANAMRRQVATYARDLANRYLARFGYTYDTWMAAVRNTPRPQMLAAAARITEGLGLETARRRRVLRSGNP